ncbi:N-acetyltransferase, partial [Streptomyces sp. NPDC018964]
MTWLPHDFVHPLHVGIPDGGGHRLRPISGADAPLDYPTVMGSRERL